MAGTAASGAIPSCSAPRQIRVGSPTGSAAASSTSRLVFDREGIESAAKFPFDVLGQRRHARRRETTRELGGRRPPRQLEQRERIPTRLGDDPVTHLGIGRTGQRRGEQDASVLDLESIQPQLGQARQLTPLRSARGRRTRLRAVLTTARRDTNASTCADISSSHCASSTMQSNGRSSALSVNRLSTARPSRKRSGVDPAHQAERRRERIALRAGEPLELIRRRP